ncbi:MAG: PLP-dependent aminotransferase family protein [bacterium]
MDWKSLFAKRVGAIGHSDVVNILKLAERPDVISFAGGLPDPNTFLLGEAKQITEEVLAEHGRTALGYGPTAGITPLREWLAGRMAQYGRSTELAETVITTGGIAALDLICKVLLDPGDVVVVGEPTYVAALHVFKSYQARFAGVQLDHEGIKTDALEAKLHSLQRESIRPKFIYTVPSFQNPAGVTLSEPRRRELLEIARSYNIPVIEDAAYRDLRFEDTTPPLLAALDPENVIHINTFSKVFNPGVRVGWATGPADIIDALILAKQGQDQCSSTIGQYLTFAFASQGLIEKQIMNAVEIYRRKRDTMLSALAEYFPQNTQWTKPKGGFYTWVILPEVIDTEKLLEIAIEKESVAYVPGPAFYHNRSGKNRLRLCYSYVSESVIEEGVQRLGRVVSKVMV